MIVPRPQPYIGQLRDGSWAIFNMPEDSDLYVRIFPTRRQAVTALIVYKLQQPIEK